MPCANPMARLLVGALSFPAYVFFVSPISQRNLATGKLQGDTCTAKGEDKSVGSMLLVVQCSLWYAETQNKKKPFTSSVA